MSLDDRCLIHFTWKLETVISILKEGFIFVGNNTRISKDLFAALEIDPPEHNVPMVCFQERKLGELKTINRQFGDFGIVVKNDWAKKNGAKKVFYLNPKTPPFVELKALLKAAKPPDESVCGFLGPHGEGPDGARLKNILLSFPSFSETLNHPLYTYLLEILKWGETDQNKNEAEHRICPEIPVGGLSEFERSDQVDVSLEFKKAGIFNNTLSVNKDDVVCFCCPQKYHEEMKEKINQTTFAGIEVVGY